jgi:alpha-N-arabinofuranosidase
LVSAILPKARPLPAKKTKRGDREGHRERIVKEALLFCNKNYTVGKIDKRIYGSFAEHMGRTIYTGIYEPGHPASDTNGFRTDVLALVKEMGVTCVRYPGGNFVSAYNWLDGTGPKQDRAPRLEPAWRSIETNQFGINEFIEWTRAADVMPVYTVNLGTKGIENAASILEYCNHEGGGRYGGLRKSHGYQNPHNIKLWCLGNEMDGDWQIGHKTAVEYANLARETAKIMKLIDPSIELISSGSSKSTMETFPEWELQTLDILYGIIDYIGLHQYYGGQEKGTPFFLAQSLDMEEYIGTVRAAIAVTKKKKRTDKTVQICFDEWGVWNMDASFAEAQARQKPWQTAPCIGEQIYTMEDTLLFASMLMVMLKNSDIVKIGCQSLLTNISSCIMTIPGAGCWVQPSYYPFSHTAQYGKGIVLHSYLQCPLYDCEQFKGVPYLDHAAVYNDADKEIVIFAVNRNEAEPLLLNLVLENFEPSAGILEHTVLRSADKKAANLTNHNLIKPEIIPDIQKTARGITADISPLSWNVLRIGVK